MDRSRRLAEAAELLAKTNQRLAEEASERELARTEAEARERLRAEAAEAAASVNKALAAAADDRGEGNKKLAEYFGGIYAAKLLRLLPEEARNSKVARETLHEAEALFDRPGGVWLAHRVNLILRQASLCNTSEERTEAEAHIQRARQLAGPQANTKLEKDILGKLDWAAADVIYNTYSERFKSPAPFGDSVRVDLERAQELYAAAESLLADAEEDAVAKNLSRLPDQSLPGLRRGTFKGALKLNDREVDQLKDFVGRTFELRRNATTILNRLLNQSGELSNWTIPFSPRVKLLAQNYRKLVKPMALVTDTVDSQQQRLHVIARSSRLAWDHSRWR